MKQLVILISNWKKKVLGLVLFIIVLVALLAGLPHLKGLIEKSTAVFQGVGAEEKIPSGNPLRVDRGVPNGNDVVERFVVKLQDFYYEERE